MIIPLVDLKAQYQTIKDEIDAAIAGVIESARFVGGEVVSRFEQNFARYVEADYAVGTSSGTSALHLALMALGIGPGDEVITSCNTFIATVEAIRQTGARPVLVDVEEGTLTIDPARIEQAVTSKTKAIVPVHLYGQSADMGEVSEVAAREGLKVVADAAQAHGATFRGSRRALLGDVACFSFYPGKNLGAYGDGGMVVTDDEELAAKVRILSNHGRSGKYYHVVEGYNYRLDALQAAVLDVKLKHLDRWNDMRRSLAALYDKLLADTPLIPVGQGEGRHHVYHLYVARTPERDRLLEELNRRGIGAGVHYPLPLHLQEACSYLGLGEGSFPVAEKAAREVISLPLYPEMTEKMVEEVVEAVMEILS